MAKYDVYKHPADGMEAIQQGFSGPAFLLTTLWALWKRLWPQAAGLWFAGVGCRFLGEFLTQEAPAVADYVFLTLVLGVMIYTGIRGNEWLADRLTARGYKFVATVDAESQAAAIGAVDGANEASPDSVGPMAEPVGAVNG